MKENIEKLIEISDYIKDNESSIQLKRIKQSMEDKSYILSVMGQFSAGKSRLINNLVGKEILPVHISETTAIITYIRYGTEECAEIRYSDGSFDVVSINETLEMWQSGSSSEMIQKIDNITIRVNSDLLKNGLILVDTPGINTIIDSHIEEAEKILTGSDRIIYVFGKPLTETDVEFLESISQCGIRFIPVRTHMDELKTTEENPEESVSKEREKLSEITEEKVFFVSNESNNNFHSGINELYNYLLVNIAGDTAAASERNTRDRMKFISEKLSGRINDKKSQINNALNSSKEEYQSKRKESLETLENLEKILENKRKNLRNKCISEKNKAKETVNSSRKSELNRLEKYINNMNINSPDCQVELEKQIRKSWHRMQNDFTDAFNIILRENKESFIEEMQNNEDLSVYIPSFPENIEDSTMQVRELNERIFSLINLKKQADEQLSEIEAAQNEDSVKYEHLKAEAEAIKAERKLIQEQLDNFPSYVARYVTVKGDHSHEKAWKTVGTIADWATILIPGKAWASMGQKVLNAGAKSAKALKAVKTADAFVDGARIMGKLAQGAEAAKAVKTSKLIKNPQYIETAANVMRTIGIERKNALERKYSGDNYSYDPSLLDVPETEDGENPFSPVTSQPPKASIIDMLGLDYWFGKIGRKFDTPDTKVIDTEYRNKYDSEKKKLTDEMQKQINEEMKRQTIMRDFKSEAEKRLFEEKLIKNKQSAVDKQIAELQKEVEKEKSSAKETIMKNHYKKVAETNIDSFSKHLITDVLPDLTEKMEEYINTYDFKISQDINAKRNELNDIEKNFNSDNHHELEKELNTCINYSAALDEISR